MSGNIQMPRDIQKHNNDMVRVKPFAAIRPPKGIVTEVAAPPYDVLNSEEAKAMAGEKSLLHITKPEIDFDPILEDHDPRVYDKAVQNFKLWQQNGWLNREEKECYYVYAQTMGERTQYGIVLCAHTDDYASGKIKKHELTRRDKEDDRMIHVRIQNANIEPVFFAYKDNETIDSIVAAKISGTPEYDFVDENGFRHTFWVIDEDDLIARITEAFTGSVEAFYVADGHHRTAAAARVGEEKRSQNPAHTGDEEYNFFMAVCFPESQLKILDYNRVVKDLNGLGKEEFLEAGSGQDSVQQGSQDRQENRLCRWDPRTRRTLPQGGQRGDEGGFRPLPGFDEAAYRHCRHRQHNASKDNLVRAEAPLRPVHPLAGLGKHP